MTKAAVPTVLVPADLLTRACQLLGELPAKHSASVYVDLLACKAADQQAAALPSKPSKRRKT
jgi:hypothetical protein